jgi:cytosine/adenosine deaminase-related metal-dependent hydrolase
MGELSDWYEAKRLMVNPHTHIDTLRLLIREDDDPLLLAVYDEITDPRSLALASARQSRGGQRRRRLKRMTHGVTSVRRKIHPSEMDCRSVQQRNTATGRGRPRPATGPERRSDTPGRPQRPPCP